MSRLAALWLLAMVAGCSGLEPVAVPHESDVSRPWSGAWRPRTAIVGGGEAQRRSGIVAGQLIVKLKPEAGRRVEAARAHGAGPTATGLSWFDVLSREFRVQRVEPVFVSVPSRPGGIASTSLRYVYQLVFPSETDVHQAAAAYRAQPDVEYAEPNYLASIQPSIR